MKTILEQLDEAEKANKNALDKYFAVEMDAESASEITDEFDSLVEHNIRALIDVAKAAQGHCNRVVDEQILVSDSECEIIDALEKLTSPSSENSAP